MTPRYLDVMKRVGPQVTLISGLDGSVPLSRGTNSEANRIN